MGSQMVLVFSPWYLSLGPILQNFTKKKKRSSCGKELALRLKLAQLTRKDILSTHLHKICWASFPNFTTYCLTRKNYNWYLHTRQILPAHPLWLVLHHQWGNVYFAPCFWTLFCPYMAGKQEIYLRTHAVRICEKIIKINLNVHWTL